MKKVLFVCTGNTCRSPMAEVIFNRMAADRGLGKEFAAVSAGIYPVPGDPATAGAVHAVEEMFGLDLKGHAARLLEAEHLEEAWVVLVMTGRHLQGIQEAFPDLSKQVHLLKEFAGQMEGPMDIADPYGLSDEAYEACAQEIFEALEEASEKFFESPDEPI